MGPLVWHIMRCDSSIDIVFVDVGDLELSMLGNGQRGMNRFWRQVLQIERLHIHRFLFWHGPLQPS